MNNLSNITKIIESFFKEFENIRKEIITSFSFDKSENHPDLVIIKTEEKQSIGIEQVKNLRSWAYNRPYIASNKLIIIENADLLTNEAQNSILKITEEPPEFTHIYLLVENHKNLLPTLISRSEIINKKGNFESEGRVEEFMKLSTLGRFNFVDTLSKEDKKKIQLFIDELIFLLRKERKFEIIEKLLFLKDSIEKNVNKKLVLDNLVLLLDQS